MPRPSPLLLHGALALVLLPGSGAASDDAWVRVRSPHFEVLSDAGAAPAREAARQLERLRGVLLELLPPRADEGSPITLFVIGDEARFRSLVPRTRSSADLAAFFQGGTERDYAVLLLSPASVRPFEPAEHEYAHLAQNASLPAQPVWVAEGLAGVLSGGILTEHGARLGAARPEYEALLRQPSSLSIERLLEIGYDSAEYGGHGETTALYARSWALVRWVLHRHGLAGLRSFLEALAEGEEPAGAFAQRLGPVQEAEATLLDVPPGPLLRVPVEGGTNPPLETDAPPPPDVDQRLGDLLFHGGHTKAAARRFERALAASPAHVPTRTSLAGLLVGQGEWDAARGHLLAVLSDQPDDPAALLRMARLRLAEAADEGVPLRPAAEAEVVAALETALSRAPQLHEAALLLTQLRPEPAEERIALLRSLFDRQPSRTEVALALAKLHLKGGDLSNARRVLEHARGAAPDPTRRYLAEHQLGRLEVFRVATAEVRGDLVFVACRPDGSLLLTVVADPRTLKLEAESTRSFFVHGEPGTEAELVCGYQDRPVVVRYAPGTSPDPAVAGEILWLAFDET